jgi:xylulose-5-phosphate/fructose-6-phosphate phosphoketolase
VDEELPPEELFDDAAAPAELAELPRAGAAHERQPAHQLAASLLRDLRLPDFRDYAVDGDVPGAVTAEVTRRHGAGSSAT